MYVYSGSLGDNFPLIDYFEDFVLESGMEIEQETQIEDSMTFNQKCKLAIFLICCVSIVIYIGICLRTIYNIRFYYPSQTRCDQ